VDEVGDLVRFNEAIDQALAESTSRFSEDLDRTRETFLGILGHDLRSPLGAVVTSARFMLEELELPATAHKLTSTILSSGERMNEMVADLLDFTRSRLGVAMPVTLEDVDIAELLESAVEEIKASVPGSAITLETKGNLKGEFDGPRLRQVMSNLLSNALNHGAGAGVAVTAYEKADDVIFAVHNDGPRIPAEQIPQIFDPLTRHPSVSHDSQHLGLGLYIARQVVLSHGGTINVESTPERGTTFTVCLPRQRSRIATEAEERIVSGVRGTK
jgi:signal transduction histidine kinase